MPRSAPMNAPTVLVVGATGPTGLAVAREGQALGLRWRCLARRPESAAPLAALGHEVVQGDVLSPDALASALQGIEVVVSLLGTPLILGRVTLLSTGTANLVEAMRRKGVRRLVCVTGMGAGDSRGHGPWLYDNLLLPVLLGRVYADKDRQEEVVRGSGLEWTLVRPAMLTNAPARNAYRRITRWQGERLSRISRADVAHFLVQEATRPAFPRETVHLTD